MSDKSCEVLLIEHLGEIPENIRLQFDTRFDESGHATGGISMPIGLYAKQAVERITALEAENQRLEERLKDYIYRLGIANNEKTKLQESNTKLLKQLKVYREAIDKFLDGDYPHPRTYRPNNCPHGVYYWEDCNDCDIEHFTRALNQDTEGKE